MSNRITSALAVTALVIAVLGATPAGEAAWNAIAPGSVGTAQLRNGAVVTPKIRDGAVTGAKVKDGSLRAADFAAGQLPAGPKGDPGAPGAQGAPGAKGETGARGPAGLTRAFTVSTPSGSAQALPKSTTPPPLARLQLPSGRFLIVAKITLSGGAPNFTGICSLKAGDTSDSAVAADYGGAPGSNAFSLSMFVLHEFDAAGLATLSCGTPRAGFWIDGSITAVEVSGTIRTNAPPEALPGGKVGEAG